MRNSSHGKPHASFDRTNPRFWQVSETYTGLTPAGLHAWLNLEAKTKTYWPQTYAELMQIGLGAAVIDWLAIVVAWTTSPPASESEVVEVFVDLMYRIDFGPDSNEKIAFGSTRSTLRNSEQLVAAMARELASMVASRWPQNVLSLESQESR